jgi:transcriptional regulator with GAF, ATPase, and Fis domain
MNIHSAPVAAALASAAEAINCPRNLEETLDAIVRAAQSSVPGIDHAGISISHRDGRIETLAGTDQLVWRLDGIQYALNEGPGVDSVEREPAVVVEHAARDQRWPEYIPRAVDAGLRSQLALRLNVDGETFGVLNLYSTRSDTVDIEAQQIAQLFATHAAIALGWARHDEQLNEALSTRKVIGQALGIVMQRYEIDEHRAFHFLARASSTSNIKLRVIAQEIVDATNEKFSGNPG